MPRDAGGPIFTYDGGPPDLRCLADAGFSEAERSLLQMPANSWLTMPNTAFSAFCVPLEQPGVHGCCGCPAVVEAWGSGIFDDANRQLILFGGGHTDYWGNEVYAFDLKTMSWRLLKASTPVTQSQLNQDPLYDGTPNSRHTYDNLVYLRGRGAMFLYGGSQADNGGGVNTTWVFDIASATWTLMQARLNQYVPHYFNGSAYDESTDAIYIRDEYGLHRWSPATDTTEGWRDLVDLSGTPYAIANTRRGIVDPKRRLFLTGGHTLADGTLDFVAFDLATQKITPYAMTGDSSALKRLSPGWDLDAAHDVAVAWSGGAPGILNLATHEWSVGSSVGAPPAQTDTGTFGRFRYVSYLNVFVLVNRAADNVSFYKLTPGCGP